MKTDMAGAAAVLGAMQVIARCSRPFRSTRSSAPARTCPRYRTAAGRHRSGAQRQDGRSAQHGRRRATRAGRRARLGRGARAFGDDRSRHADRRDHHGAWSLHDGVVLARGCAGGRVPAAARAAGEELWRMPMPDNMKDLIKSPIADLKNMGGPKGGSITAALVPERVRGRRPLGSPRHRGRLVPGQGKGLRSARSVGRGRPHARGAGPQADGVVLPSSQPRSMAALSPTRELQFEVTQRTLINIWSTRLELHH